MAGYRGAQFPWESSRGRRGGGARTRQRRAGASTTSPLDVAQAFVRSSTLPATRIRPDAGVARRPRGGELDREPRDGDAAGLEIQRVTGVAEKAQPENNNAFVNIGAIVVLREALALAELLGAPPGTAGRTSRGDWCCHLTDEAGSSATTTDTARPTRKARRRRLPQRLSFSTTTRRHGSKRRRSAARSSWPTGLRGAPCCLRSSGSSPPGSAIAGVRLSSSNADTATSCSSRFPRPTSTARRCSRISHGPVPSLRTSGGSSPLCLYGLTGLRLIG